MELFTLLKVAKATSYPAISYLLSYFGLFIKGHIHFLFQSHLHLQASLFETVPSVEYKLLDEEKSQFDPNDSLDDITVSLNDPRSKVNGHGQKPLLQENNQNSAKCAPPLLFIDEETNLDNSSKTSETNNINQDCAVNDDDGKQVNNESSEVIKEDANDAHKSQADSELIKSSGIQSNEDINQDTSCKVETLENDIKRKDSVEENFGKQTPLMSSRLSVASGESAGSISFSADSLGINFSLHIFI